MHYQRAVMGIYLNLSQHWIRPCLNANPDFTA
jgi:hypothetical protein